MKKIIITLKLISILLTLTYCNSYKEKGNSSNYFKKEIINKKFAKQYFFARCITNSYSKKISEQILKDDVSFSILIDIGNLWKISSQLDSLAKEKSKLIKATQISDYQNKKPTIFRCLELYESRKIDSIINKIIISHK